MVVCMTHVRNMVTPTMAFACLRTHNTPTTLGTYPVQTFLGTYPFIHTLIFMWFLVSVVLSYPGVELTHSSFWRLVPWPMLMIVSAFCMLLQISLISYPTCMCI